MNSKIATRSIGECILEFSKSDVLERNFNKINTISKRTPKPRKAKPSTSFTKSTEEERRLSNTIE